MIAEQSVAHGEEGADARASPLAYSIIVPLFDCRDAGTRALQSALDQTFPRERYEVIAIVDATASRDWPNALLAQCDHVVTVDADFRAVESEIMLFDAGAKRARGDCLYFIEGHTVLVAGALHAIDAAVKTAGGWAIACGRRTNHAATRLGALIGTNNDVHEARACEHGGFTLGANCVIRRSAFEALGGFDAALQRFNEAALYERALQAQMRFVAVDVVLCTHHNDAGLRWLIRLLVATGHAKARHYRSLRDAGTPLRIRHPVYRWLYPAPAAALAIVPLRAAGPLLIVVSMALARAFPRLAVTIYRLGVGCTDVSGFCVERAFGQRHRGAPSHCVATHATSAQSMNAVVGRMPATIE